MLRLKPTFHFCKYCPKTENCCTSKTVDPPVLTPNDVDNICKKTGLTSNEFCISAERGLSEMKRHNGHCYFYQNEKCTIYRIRPVDCKLFPFDVYKNNKGELLLLCYLSACPIQIDVESCIEKARSFLKDLYPYLEEFAEHNSPLLDHHNYKVIETIEPANQ